MVEPRPMPVMQPMRPGFGDFDADWQPTQIVPPGFGGGGGGGNLMGPNHPLFDGRGGVGGGVGGVGGRGRGMQPRFDPWGPVPGMGEPDNDELLPPGGRGRGNRRGGFNGRGGFGSGFPDII